MWVAWVVLAACKRFPLVNPFISLTNSKETKLSYLMVESITQLYHRLSKLSGAMYMKGPEDEPLAEKLAQTVGCRIRAAYQQE